MVGTPKRKFDAEFKKQAVKLLLDSEKSAAEIAQDLGIGTSMLYKWKRAYTSSPDSCFAGKGHAIPKTGRDAEIERLKRENEDLRMERDILKKAAAIFLKR